MKKLVNAWLATMLFSTIYGWYIFESDQMGFFAFFGMMILVDSLLISYVERLPTTDTTILFMIVLVISMGIHLLGGFNWLAYNQDAPYIACKTFIVLLEFLVIAGGGISGYINGRNQAGYRHYRPGIINIMENKTCH